MTQFNLNDVFRAGRSAAVTTALIASLGTAALAGDTARSTQAGDITIEQAFSRETLPNQPVAGAFMTVRNMGAASDRLIGGETEIAGRVEIHEMAMVGDVMKMRKLEDGLEIPAGQDVELKPGGYHVMFFDLTGPLKEGEMFEVTLEFAEAGKVVLPVMVMGKGAKSAQGH